MCVCMCTLPGDPCKALAPEPVQVCVGGPATGVLCTGVYVCVHAYQARVWEPARAQERAWQSARARLWWPVKRF